MADYRLSLEANADLRRITAYTRDRYGLAQAFDYTEQIIRSVELAAIFPLSRPEYVTRDGRSYRRCDSGRHIAFYRVEESAIFVVRILHQAMDFDRHP